AKWPPGLAVVHIIRGKVNQRNVTREATLREFAHAFHVERKGFFGLALSFVNGGVRGAIHTIIKAVFAKKIRHVLRVGNVQLKFSGKNEIEIRELVGKYLKFLPHLPRRTCN